MYQLTMTSADRADAERHGLMILSRLAENTPCDYEERLLQSLLVYGRACYQLDPNDKLLQIMTAIEMFTLRSTNEPIQAGLLIDSHSRSLTILILDSVSSITLKRRTN